MEFVRTGFLQLLWSSFLLAGILAVGGRFGGFVLALSGLRRGRITNSEARIFSAAAGIIFLTLGVLALGLCSHVDNCSAWLLLVFLFLCPFALKHDNLFSISLPNVQPRDRLWLCAFALPLFFSWLQTSAPPTGNDALAYHLVHPKEFILAHRISYLPGTWESLWPYLTEMLFTLGLLLQGTILAQLFHWFFYGLTGIAVYSFMKRFHGRDAGLIAALIFLYTPAVFVQSSQAYVDLSLAFYVFCAFYAFQLEEPVLSGLMAGGAVSVKYLGLDAALILFVLWAWRSKVRWKSLVFFCLPTAAVGSVWYLRSWLITGNPVRPFFHSVFGGDAVYKAADIFNTGLGRGAAQFLLLPWNLAFYPGPFGGERIGFLYLVLMALPLLLFFGSRPRRSDIYTLCFAVLMTFLIFLQSQQVRFFIMVLPFWAAGSAVLLSSFLNKKAGRTLVVGFLALACLAYTAIFIRRSSDLWPNLLGKEGTRDYLARKERSFEGNEYLVQNLKPGESVINVADPRVFYGPSLSRIVIGGPELDRLNMDWNRISGFLDSRKFTYFWLDLENLKVLPQYSEYLTSRGYQEAFSYHFTEGKGDYRYVIYRAQG